MFDGALGNKTGSEYKIEYLEETKLYHTKAFPIPEMHRETLKMEVNRLINIDVLNRKYNTKHIVPTFKIS